MTRARVSPALAVAFAMIFAISACGSQSSATATGDVTFGAIIGQSGVYGANGPGFIAGVKVAADKINAAGGISADGKKLNVKVLITDDRSDSQVAVADAIQMIDDNHLKVIFGPLALAANAVAPIANQNKVINVTACSCAQNAGAAPFPLLFYRQPSNSSFMGVVVSAAKHFYPSAKTFAIMADNSGNNPDLTALLKTDLAAAGLTALDFTYPAGTADLSTVAAKVAAAKPDIVWATTSVQEVVNDMNSLDAAGVPKSVPIFSEGGDVSTQAKASGRPTVTFISNAIDVVHDNSPDINAFKQALIAKNGAPIDDADLPPAQYYYFAMQLIAKAMTLANSTTDTAAIAKAMLKVSLTEFGSQFQWNAAHYMSYALAIVSYSATGDATVAHLNCEQNC